MNALVTLVLLSAAPCFVPTDTTPGWKQVTLPENAQSLAVESDVQQFRSEAPVTLREEHPNAYRSGYESGLGKTEFDFALGRGGRSIDLEFSQPLRGAEVDVLANNAGNSMTLMQGERQGGARMHLEWGDAEVTSVSVVIHQHLRQRPVVKTFRTERRLPGNAVGSSTAFQLPRSLYYLQPAGVPVRLCNDPGRELTMKEEVPGSETRPMPVTLRPG